MSNIRPYTNELLRRIDDFYLSSDEVIRHLLCFLSEDQVKELVHDADWFDLEDEVEDELPSKYESNGWRTTDLVLNVMQRCASTLGLDLDDDETSDGLYEVCCSLETWNDDEGIGTSDVGVYVRDAAKYFNIERDIRGNDLTGGRR